MSQTTWEAISKPAGLARDATARKAGESVAETATATELKAARTKTLPKPAPKAKAAPRATKPSRKAAEAAASADHNATAKAEAEATLPDFEAAAEQDEILVERRAMVKAWRKAEVEKHLTGP